MFLHVDIQHELLRRTTGQTQSTTLSDGHELHGINGAELGSRFVDDACGTERNSVTEERFTTSRLADEAHILTVGLGGGTQAEFAGSLAHLRLREMTYGKQRVGKLTLIQHVHHIALVLGGIRPAHDSPHTGWLSLDARMVARGNGIEAEQARALRQTVELEMTIALDARIGGGSRAMGIDVRINYVGGEIVGEVEYQVVDSQLLRHTTGIVHITHRTTAGVALATPQSHGDSHHFVAFATQFGCSDG